jgi:hypothetical protein
MASAATASTAATTTRSSTALYYEAGRNLVNQTRGLKWAEGHYKKADTNSSEPPYTGARPSVRLCVRPEHSRCVHKGNHEIFIHFRTTNNSPIKNNYANYIIFPGIAILRIRVLENHSFRGTRID